jgi:hypothetical protein
MRYLAFPDNFIFHINVYVTTVIFNITELYIYITVFSVNVWNSTPLWYKHQQRKPTQQLSQQNNIYQHKQLSKKLLGVTH